VTTAGIPKQADCVHGRRAFDVNEYWLRRGKTYVSEERLASEYYRRQERFLLDRLLSARLPMQRILELGCGFGRITRLLASTFPTAAITAVDLSPDQLAHARVWCAEARNITFLPYDIYSNQSFPSDRYDTAIAIEVFLHHPLDAVTRAVDRLAAVSSYIVNLDWSEDWTWEIAEHVWVHDYAAMYRGRGLRCQEFTLPEKIDGQQQKLFIASHPDAIPGPTTGAAVRE